MNETVEEVAPDEIEEKAPVFHEDTLLWNYQRIFRKLCLKENKGHISDKNCGVLLGVSERMIRKARIEGMDDYMADKFCCKLGLHPKEVFGDVWVARGLFAYDLLIGKVTPEEVPDLVACGAWRG